MDEAILNKIVNTFVDGKNKAFRSFYKGNDTRYADAYAYAMECGRLSSKTLLEYIPTLLESGEITTGEAEAIIASVMGESSKAVEYMAVKAQDNLLASEKLTLKAIQPEQGEIINRIRNLCIKYASDPEKGIELIKEAIQQAFAKSVVVDTQKTNADFAQRAGLRVKIRRVADAGCCKWCTSMAGEWNAGNAPKDVWRFHTNCGCYIEYTSQKGVRDKVSFSNGTKNTQRI